MKNKFKIIFFLIFSFSVFGLAKSSYAATTYYVDKDSIGGTCNDNNNGASTATPWCTISKANTTLAAGDTVYIRAGEYTVTATGGIAPVNSGSAGSIITYSGYESEEVILDGSTYRLSVGIDLGTSLAKIIKGVTKANPGVITTASAHGFTNGDEVFIYNVAGMREVDGKVFTVTNATTNTFGLSGVNTSGYGAYVSGGYAYKTPNKYTKVTKLKFRYMNRNFVISYGSHHNEISYCEFGPQPDRWSESREYTSGIAKQTSDGHTLYRQDGEAGSVIAGYTLINLTDGSACEVGSVTPTTITCGTASGDLAWGTNNTWTIGDSYRVSPNLGGMQSAIDYGSNNNWFHHNIVRDNGAFTWRDDTELMRVGIEIVGTSTSALDFSDNNTIEYNHLYHGGHHVLGVNGGRYNVIKNNYIHNEGWFVDNGYLEHGCGDKTNGVCGYIDMFCTAPRTYGGISLFEGNAIGYGAQYGGPHMITGASGGGVTLGTSDNIYRYNDHFSNVSSGLRLAGSIQYGTYNKVYNNTFYRNGYNESSYGNSVEDDAYLYDSSRIGINFYETDTAKVHHNVVKNNLFYLNWAERNRTSTMYYPALNAVSAVMDGANTVTNNFYVRDSSYLYGVSRSTPGYESGYSVETNPLFVDPDVTTPLGENVWTTIGANAYKLLKPNLSLKTGSTAIDQGTYLTLANGAVTNNNVLTVDDAGYFQDGSWGSSLATLNADWIAIGTVDNVVQISSINYVTNTITLASTKTWADNAPVWLYKKSDGTRVLYDTKPDMGAHEYSEASEITPPSAPSGLSVN
ncbi:MAG: ubiquitin-activating E1 FCCH domain-containing protein [Dehalococcoidales bacterium]|nr:ubiquitin-activating E1 FCCH domain-containing protein [Dehalococcoidales bacterium]